jgi:hypothetical protein
VADTFSVITFIIHLCYTVSSVLILSSVGSLLIQVKGRDKEPGPSGHSKEHSDKTTANPGLEWVRRRGGSLKPRYLNKFATVPDSMTPRSY